MNDFLTLDLMPLLAAVFAAVSCGLLGNFLVLRRLSLMGDAISHAVLPGIAAAFVVTQSRDPVAMLLGAGVAALVTVVFVEVIKRLGRVEPGAAMGVTFSVLFALGVLLIERTARSVDLDADCVLYGQLETLASFGSLGEAIEIPRQIITLAIVTAVSLVFVTGFFKELRIAAFDPGLATSMGFSAGLMHMLLMTLVAAAAVASFEAVGSILVIAMLIAPAATARMLTDRLRSQIIVSLLAAFAASVGGYFLAVHADKLPFLGLSRSLDAAGMITLCSGILFVAAALGSPSHGVIARVIRRRALSERIGVEDLLATLFRVRESGADPATRAALARTLGARAIPAIATAERRGLAHARGESIILTDDGVRVATDLVRRHRLWETYLVDRAGVRPDHAHAPAETLEHARTTDRRPIAPALEVSTDPHGKAIPPGQ